MGCHCLLWISYKYTYIPSLHLPSTPAPPSHPSGSTTEHQAELPALSGRFPLAICFTQCRYLSPDLLILEGMLFRWFNYPVLNDIINRRLAKLKVWQAIFPDIHTLRVSKVHLWVKCSNKPQHGKSHPKTEKKKCCYFVPHKKCGSKWKAYQPQLIQKQRLTPSRESGTGSKTPFPALHPTRSLTELSGLGRAISL